MSETYYLLIASENKYFTLLNTKDFVDIDEKKKFENINERQLTSEQQKKLIFRETISSSPQFILSQTIFIEKSISTEQMNVSNSSTFIKKQQNKTSLLSSSDKKIKTVEKETKYSNYNELNDSNRQHRKKKSNAN